MNDEEIRRALAQSPVLADLDPNALQFLTRFGTIRQFAAGDALMRQGEPSVSIHFVLSGGVEVERQRRSDERPVKLAVFGVGESARSMPDIARRYARALALHRNDLILPDAQHH